MNRLDYREWLNSQTAANAALLPFKDEEEVLEFANQDFVTAPFSCAMYDLPEVVIGRKPTKTTIFELAPEFLHAMDAELWKMGMEMEAGN